MGSYQSSAARDPDASPSTAVIDSKSIITTEASNRANIMMERRSTSARLTPCLIRSAARSCFRLIRLQFRSGWLWDTFQ